jgi:hypothetical protein
MAWLPCDGVLPKRWGLIYAQCSAPHSFASTRADMGSLCTTLQKAPTRPVRWALRMGVAVPDGGTTRAQLGRCGGHAGTALTGWRICYIFTSGSRNILLGYSLI